MTLHAATFANDHIGINDFRYYSDERRKAWAPAHTWSMCWCGKNRSLVNGGSGGVVVYVEDASGNERDWENDTGSTRFDGSQGLTTEDWSTALYVLQAVTVGAGSRLWLLSPMTAAGEFYLAASVFNSRGSGTRYMWGNFATGNYVRLRQADHQLEVRIADGTITEITAVGAVPETNTAGVGEIPIFLEVWRDSSNVIHVAADMVEIGLAPTVGGTFVMDGWSVDSGAGAWDDWLLEFWVANAALTLQERREAYNFQRVKWGF